MNNFILCKDTICIAFFQKNYTEIISLFVKPLYRNLNIMVLYFAFKLKYYSKSINLTTLNLRSIIF